MKAFIAFIACNKSQGARGGRTSQLSRREQEIFVTSVRTNMFPLLENTAKQCIGCLRVCLLWGEVRPTI